MSHKFTRWRRKLDQWLTPSRIVGLYIAAGLLWMAVANRLLAAVDPTTMVALQTVRGVVFVVGSGVLLYALIRRNSLALKQSQQEFQRAAHLYRLLSHCNQELIRAKSEPELLHSVCHWLVELGGYPLAWIGFIERDSARPVRPVAWVGDDTGYIEAVTNLWDDTERGHGPTGRAIRSGVPEVAQHISSDPDYSSWHEESLKRGYTSAIALPIWVNGGMIGALTICAGKPDAFDQQDINLLDELSKDLAYGIGVLRANVQHQQAETAMRESEERFSATFHQAAVGIGLIAQDGHFLRVNQRYCDIVGHTLEEMLALGVRDITYPADHEIDLRFQRQLLAGAIQTYTLQKRYIRGDRSLVWVNVTVSLVRNSDGSPKYSIGVIEDISSRKQTEAALQKSHYHLKIAQKIGHIGSWEWDISTGLVTWSDEMYRIFGIDPLDFPDGVPIPDFFRPIHPDDRERVKHINQQAVEQQTPVAAEYRVVWPDGTVRLLYTTCQADRDDGGNCIKLIGVVQDITERKQVERELEAERNLLRTLIDNLPDEVYAKDLDSRFIIANARVSRRFGLTPKELIGKSDFDLHPPEQAAAYRAEELAILDSGEPMIDSEFSGIDKVQWWVLTSKIPLRDKQGNVIGLVGINRNITERKQMEAFEREQRLMAETLRDTSAALLSTLDLHEVLDRVLGNVTRVVTYDTAHIVFVEGDFARIVRCKGYADPDLETAMMNQSWPIADIPYLRQIVETGKPLVIDDLVAYLGLPEDSTLWVRGYVAAPIRAYGQVIGLINLESTTPGFFDSADAERLQSFADLSALAIVNAQLYDSLRDYAVDLTRRFEERKAELQAILDSMGEGVLFLDQQQIRYINRAFSTLTGYSADEIIGQDARLYHDLAFKDVENPEQMVAVIQDTLQRRETWRGEQRVGRKGGSPLDVGLTMTAVHGPDGQHFGDVVIIQDISGRKALQEQKDRFIASASHELRTPITTINLRIYLLRHQPEKMEYHLNVLEQATARMTSLVEDLLDLSRFERGVITLKRKPTVLQTLITDVVVAQQPQADNKQIDLKYVLAVEPLTAYVDPTRITQVVTNLVVNAINYTPEGGRISVELAVEGEEATIRVQDTGIGMSQQSLAHIFEPFFRGEETEVLGTGLGLSIAKEIVDRHGGTITVESEVGQGSTFTVHLPLENLAQK